MNWATAEDIAKAREERIPNKVNDLCAQLVESVRRAGNDIDAALTIITSMRDTIQNLIIEEGIAKVTIGENVNTGVIVVHSSYDAVVENHNTLTTEAASDVVTVFISASEVSHFKVTLEQLVKLLGFGVSSTYHGMQQHQPMMTMFYVDDLHYRAITTTDIFLPSNK